VPEHYSVYFVYGRPNYPAAGDGVAHGGSMAGGSADSVPALVEINLADDVPWVAAPPGSSADVAASSSSSSSNAPPVDMPAAEVPSPGSAATSSVNNEAPWRRIRGKIPSRSPPACELQAFSMEDLTQGQEVVSSSLRVAGFG